MLCTIITRNNQKEILYKESNEGPVLDVPEEKVKEIQECSYDRVQDLILQLMKNNTSRHHLIPQFHGGKWASENIIRLNHHVHESFHVFFGHKTPVDQIKSILNLNEAAMHPDIVSEIRRVLDRYNGILELSAYNPNCINEEKFIYSKRL